MTGELSRTELTTEGPPNVLGMEVLQSSVEEVARFPEKSPIEMKRISVWVVHPIAFETSLVQPLSLIECCKSFSNILDFERSLVE